MLPAQWLAAAARAGNLVGSFGDQTLASWLPVAVLSLGSSTQRTRHDSPRLHDSVPLRIRSYYCFASYPAQCHFFGFWLEAQLNCKNCVCGERTFAERL